MSTTQKVEKKKHSSQYAVLKIVERTSLTKINIVLTHNGNYYKLVNPKYKTPYNISISHTNY